ncbi:MAG: DNA repair protein RecN [Rickettsiales bacterium]
MLHFVSLVNVALIEKAELSLPSGFCAFTGETGAGKSVLLNALAFATGKRPAKGLLRAGAEEGSVSAAFGRLSLRVKAILDAAGLSPDENGEIILRRRLWAEGRSRAYVNDCAVGAPLLKELGDALMEIHGQHDKRGLQDASNHRAMLDRYAGLSDAAKKVGDAFAEKQGAERAWLRAREERAALERDKDFLAYAVKELEALSPEPGLESLLEEKRLRVKNAERLQGARAELEAALYGSEDGTPGFAALSSRIAEAIAHAAQWGGGTGERGARFREHALEAEAAAEEALRVLDEGTQPDEATDALEDRLYALRLAARKYGVESDALPDVLEETRRKLIVAQGGTEDESRHKKRADVAWKAYADEAGALHEKREEAARKLGEALTRELRELYMPHAEAFVSISRLADADGGKHGVTDVEFMLRSNPGMPPGPLASIASGGELSRCMLAFKAVLSEGEGGAASMIFDEIDSGVSGAAAEAVGVRLKALGKKAQIFVVTHQPQVAACADAQFLVEKKTDGLHTRTEILALSPEGRVEEISRLFSGAAIGLEATRMAEKLLADARASS